ncbi:hypothetical protein [Desulforamulus aeronauticus]|uniref:Uncharacterized protein n=1 Tax=Desulforamulus aeronauticus DSM 10349 TaxID=1121421 RepID=A0A1M6RPY0_9FIRM|nr:hypothetical protein [Desulforamulus aeronauticus]SHK34526.1 hypothetical protein SAMN02745123_01560 [Desulforamulus aeronauticus DSM 10349]
MSEKSSSRLASNLEQLVSRMENIHFQRGSEMDQVSGVLGNMDKLVDVLARIELQRQSEQQLNEKLDRLSKIMERVSEETVPTRDDDVAVEQTLRKIIKGVKVTGKVMDIIAGSLGAMFDTISTTVKQPDRQNLTRSNNKEIDLASVLAPVGALLQGFLGVASEQSDSSSKSSQSKTSKPEDIAD